jgi:hypothetical protein
MLMTKDDREHTRSFQIDLTYKNMVVNFDALSLTVSLEAEISGHVRLVQGKRECCESQVSAVQGARRGQCKEPSLTQRVLFWTFCMTFSTHASSQTEFLIASHVDRSGPE